MLLAIVVLLALAVYKGPWKLAAGSEVCTQAAQFFSWRGRCRQDFARAPLAPLSPPVAPVAQLCRRPRQAQYAAHAWRRREFVLIVNWRQAWCHLGHEFHVEARGQGHWFDWHDRRRTAPLFAAVRHSSFPTGPNLFPTATSCRAFGRSSPYSRAKCCHPRQKIPPGRRCKLPSHCPTADAAAKGFRGM